MNKHDFHSFWGIIEYALTCLSCIVDSWGLSERWQPAVCAGVCHRGVALPSALAHRRLHGELIQRQYTVAGYSCDVCVNDVIALVIVTCFRRVVCTRRAETPLKPSSAMRTLFPSTPLTPRVCSIWYVVCCSDCLVNIHIDIVHSISWLLNS